MPPFLGACADVLAAPANAAAPAAHSASRAAAGRVRFIAPPCGVDAPSSRKGEPTVVASRPTMAPPRIRDDLEAVELVPHPWIELADGCRLGARLWLPLGARERPVPAVLEYLPYRKGEGTAPGDHLQMTYLAAHGLAGVRVDIRGSGDSDGLLLDEYLPQEL